MPCQSAFRGMFGIVRSGAKRYDTAVQNTAPPCARWGASRCGSGGVRESGTDEVCGSLQREALRRGHLAAQVLQLKGFKLLLELLLRGGGLKLGLRAGVGCGGLFGQWFLLRSVLLMLRIDRCALTERLVEIRRQDRHVGWTCRRCGHEKTPQDHLRGSMERSGPNSSGSRHARNHGLSSSASCRLRLSGSSTCSATTPTTNPQHQNQLHWPLDKQHRDTPANLY